MERAVEFLKIGAVIVIVLVLISLGFLLMRSGQDTAKIGISKINQINSDIKESDIKMYDGMTVTGSEVVNTLNKFQNSSYGVKVITGKNASGTWYVRTVDESNNNALGSASSADISDTIDETDNEYVNPNGSFIGKVLRDKNGTVTGIIFTQQ